jgi:hypothetical protein
VAHEASHEKPHRDGAEEYREERCGLAPRRRKSRRDSREPIPWNAHRQREQERERARENEKERLHVKRGRCGAAADHEIWDPAAIGSALAGVLCSRRSFRSDLRL